MAAGHHRTTDPAFEETASQVAIVLQMPDLGLNGTFTFQLSPDRARHAPLLS